MALRTDSGTAIVASSTCERGVGVVRGTSARDTASCGHGAERVLALELGHVRVCYSHFVRRVALLSYLARDAGASSSPCSRAWFCSLYISHSCRHQQSRRSVPAVVIREICSSRQLYRGGSASFDQCGLLFVLLLSQLFFSVRVRVGRLQRSRPVDAKPKIVRGTRGTSFLSARASTFSFGLEQLHVILWALDTP